MARQAGPLYFTGTIDDITFYKMEGQYYARKKSSLTRKRFRTDPRFEGSRAAADQFGQASRLASTIYWQLPKEQRGKGVIAKLTSQVRQWLKEGKDADQIIEQYKQLYQPVSVKPITPSGEKTKAVRKPHASDWKITPTGKLIGPTSEPCTPANTITSLYSLVHNRYHVPQLE